MWQLKDNCLYDDEFPFFNLVTTKKLGDMKDASKRESFCSLKGIKREDLVCAEQVHGNYSARVGKEDGGRFIKNADGLVTSEKGAAIAMFTADCLPVFIGVKDKACGLVHAGWRGLQKQILVQPGLNE